MWGRGVVRGGMSSGTGWGEFDCLSALRALGEPTRLRLVRSLLGGPRTVGELCLQLGLTAYNVSKHLRILREAELLEMEKQGQQHVYRLADAFRTRVDQDGRILDLGCCQFDFSRLPD